MSTPLFSHIPTKKTHDHFFVCFATSSTQSSTVFQVIWDFLGSGNCLLRRPHRLRRSSNAFSLLMHDRSALDSCPHPVWLWHYCCFPREKSWESSPTIRCNNIFKSWHSSFAFRFWIVVRVGRASVSLMQGPTLKFRVVRCRLSDRRQCNTGAPNKSSRFENFRQKLLSLSIWRWNIWEFNKKSQMRIFIGDSDTSGQKSHFGETP